MKILILKGLPGAGKSVFAKQFCLDNPDYVRINRDSLRNMRGKYWMPEQENLITDWERMCIRVVSLQYPQLNVVLDATNLNQRNLNDLKIWIGNNLQTSVFFEEMLIDTPLEECIRRDNERTEGKVGEEIIRGFHKKYFQS